MSRTIGLSQIAAAQFLHVYQPRHWINCGQAGPLGWTIPAALGVRAADPEREDRRAVRRLRLPVHDRGTGGRRAAQAALHPRRGEQLLPRPDPPGAARLPDGLLRCSLAFENINAPDNDAEPAMAWTMSRWSRGWAARRSACTEPEEIGAGARAGARLMARVPGAGGGRDHPRARHQYLDGHRDRQHQRVRGICADKARRAMRRPPSPSLDSRRHHNAGRIRCRNLQPISPCCSTSPFLDRFDAAAKAGFHAVEYLFPYAFPKDALAERLREHGLTQVLHNLPAGDWDGGRARHRLPSGSRRRIPRRRARAPSTMRRCSACRSSIAWSA